MKTFTFCAELFAFSDTRPLACRFPILGHLPLGVEARRISEMAMAQRFLNPQMNASTATSLGKLYFLLPRPCRLRWKRVRGDIFAGQLREGKPLAENARDGFKKAAFVIFFALVEAKRLFVKVTGKMKRLYAHIGSLDCALEQAPEIFQPVRMDVALGVANRVVNHLMNVVGVHADIGAKCIGIKLRAFQHVLADIALHFMVASGLKHLQFDARFFTAGGTLKQTLNGRHSFPARILLFLGFVHEAGLSADKGFVRLNSPAHFFNGTVVDRQADTMKHKPSGGLRDAKRAVKLARTDTILGISNQPESGEPFVQLDRTVLEDRANLHAELLPASPALIDLARSHKGHFLGLAVRASRAIRPASRGDNVVGIIPCGKIMNRFVKRFGNLNLIFHERIIA